MSLAAKLGKPFGTFSSFKLPNGAVKEKPKEASGEPYMEALPEEEVGYLSEESIRLQLKRAPADPPPKVAPEKSSPTMEVGKLWGASAARKQLMRGGTERLELKAAEASLIQADADKEVRDK